MARTVAQVDARLTNEITTRTGQLAGTSGSVLLDRINALEARVKKLESPPPPVIEPLPPQVVSGPVAFGYDGQTIQNIIIDIAPSKPMTLDLQLGPIDPATGKRMGTNPTYSVYAKGRADCKARNVTVRGRNFGFLLIDLSTSMPTTAPSSTRTTARSRHSAAMARSTTPPSSGSGCSGRT